MKYSAIIFDMDGTIIDTEHIWKQATHDLITSRGIAFSPEIAHDFSKRLAGLAMRPSCTLLKEYFNLPDSVEQLIAEKHTLADALYAQQVKYIHGFLPFHTQVQRYNLKMAVATNATPQTVAITHQKLNLTALFGEHIYNIAHVNFVGKPHPAIYLHAAQQLKIAPEQCIAIEDSANGIQAAKSAGMFCIGINTARTPELLQNAHIIIDGYHELDLAQMLSLE